jgi:hypothetical protein
MTAEGTLEEQIDKPESERRKSNAEAVPVNESNTVRCWPPETGSMTIAIEATSCAFSGVMAGGAMWLPTVWPKAIITSIQLATRYHRDPGTLGIFGCVLMLSPYRVSNG